MCPCRTNSCNVAAQLTRILEEGEDDEDEGQEPLLSGGLESELPEGRTVRRTVDDDDADALPGLMRHARTSVIMRQVQEPCVLTLEQGIWGQNGVTQRHFRQKDMVSGSLAD